MMQQPSVARRLGEVLLLALGFGGWVVRAEIREIELLLPATTASIRYTEGYIRAPGSINLSDLTFETVASDYGLNDDDDLTRALDGGMELNGFDVDIAIFHLPKDCAGTRSGCDWTKLGIGGVNSEGALRYCCSGDALEWGLCEKEYEGSLILNPQHFKGKHKFISMPFDRDVKKQLKDGLVSLDNDRNDGYDDYTGQYVIVFANCNEAGRPVKIDGATIWKSDHGYLPGEFYGFMYFYGIIAIIYIVLCLFYAISMHVYRDSRIAIEKWILFTISMGMAEMVFHSADLVIWNRSGYRPMSLVYLGIILGVLKRGIMRCLAVMVSLGWGVVRDSLGPAMRMVIVLGATYVGVSATCDLMEVFFVEDFTELTTEEETDLIDIVWVLTICVAALDVIFILWILDALNGTMQYLENMSQTRKLQRFLTLRSIILFAILFATIWIVFSLVDKYDEEGIVRDEHQWVVDAAIEVNYLYLLIGVAVLWRPNPSAKEYAYVMELPDNESGDENDLELTGVVPSAMDDDDIDFEQKGIDDPADGRFQID
jgi:hypothetical protein